ncbi:ATP-dependent DNA helicase [Actinobacillus pleuropneumoniae]|uniref:ATP-dependent DNA helicase YoaA n=2 Tax=Actinobacillus pleuropneumoniae TaxID=715 RepID=B3H1C2_ACTP7|nr:ATP-dependent DNA helicase [Actinobacillus pleuropneumoniae]ACE61494.1 putative ATP-dependent helicase [Actinobacillus pleuropneumoniae serovar 7 str. AP76]EFL80133.1 ATP-dependent helicase [Actinobacillus pleuropneumoniae serovar 6 str. Femo]EFM92291.1 ATP-dependent helicase [Actinobacillus pleuropneumoniae serovar 6 str. Femo]EFN02819.1 ATP-dependent helicase [Actinobacillus pleuropneumoniae serovar 13 str. N273]KIE91177.1 putative ATP-dependent helicase [Actinobacillus pleuropneumoniae]
MKYDDKILHAFSEDGLLSSNIQGFRPRAAQLEMAQAVGRAVKFATPAVVEAGTGTGKTFAYLVPALLSGKKTIVSTGSKNLQDQLFNRDLPTIQKALKYKGKVALLKGRANYLCLERLDQVVAMGVLGDKSVLADLSKVSKWHTSTKTGDLSECITIAEDSPILPQLVSTAESCLGSDCPHFKDCYVVQARRRAMEADVVVVNHHLFCADMAVKETGFGELIPEAELIIFDEAHQLPDIASQYFGQSLSSRQLFDICKDTNIVYRTELKDLAQLGKAADHLQKTVQDFRLLMGTEGSIRGNLRELFNDQKVVGGLTKVSENIDFLSEVIKKSLGRSETLDKIFERLAEVKVQLKKLSDTSVVGYCYWYEANGRSFGLHITPLTVADKFGEQLKNQQIGWVFTSATLEVGGKFDHFCQRLGIENAEQLVLQSPFDYANQSLLCVPRYLPDTNKLHTLNELGKMLMPVIEANNGRCFLLCTSYFMMRGLADFLREHSNLSVLLQGETSKARLLEKFIAEENSVLVATQSFWEGIDVRGDALSLVIIDKLPFTSPDEPLLRARMEDCRLQGGEPFNDIQIPEAVITLKQGVGRLIRDVTDRGVVIICDSRLVMRNYGKTFLKSLPPSTRTRDLDKVIQFLKNK